MQEKELAGLAGRLLSGEVNFADRLLAVLREANSPLLSGLHKAIVAEVKELGLPQKVQLNYDRTLEKPGLQISLEASGVRELKELLQSLSESLEKSEWSRLFRLLGYERE